MDMKELAKAAARKARRRQGLDDSDIQPSPQVTAAKKKPLNIPKSNPSKTAAARNAAAAAISGKLGGRGPPPPPASRGPPPSSAGRGGGGGPLSDGDEEIAEKYRKMMKIGLPPPAVRHKMAGDGIPAHIINAVLSGGANPPPPKRPAPGGAGGKGAGGKISSLSQKEEAVAAPFRKMINIGLPPGAVRQKMMLDGGVSDKIMKSVLAGEIPAPVGGSAAPSQAAPSRPAGPPGGAGGSHPLGMHNWFDLFTLIRSKMHMFAKMQLMF